VKNLFSALMPGILLLLNSARDSAQRTRDTAMHDRDRWTRLVYQYAREEFKRLNQANPEHLAAAATAIAAHDCGFGDREHNYNPFNLHSTSGTLVGSERIARYNSRRAGVQAAVRLLSGSRYAAAKRRFLVDLGNGARFQDAMLDYWIDLRNAGYFTAEVTEQVGREFKQTSQAVWNRLFGG
jgi:hypothetical protein